MNLTKERLDVFCEMVDKALNELGCSCCYKTDTAVHKTDVDIYHSTLGPKHYLVQWDEVRSLTEAAVPILSDVKMHLELKNYCANDVEQTKNLYYGLSLSIKDVIFNPPATIVLWMDGTKTVVKDQGEVFFDPEKGMAMAIAKKSLGNNGNYYNQFKKYIDIWEEKQEGEPDQLYPTSILTDAINKLKEKMWEVNYRSTSNYNALSNMKRPKIDTEIIFKTKNDAIAVLYNLRGIMSKYGYVAVGDLYDLAELKCDYTYARYGWVKADDIHHAKIVKTRNGYMIDLPEPTELK